MCYSQHMSLAFAILGSTAFYLIDKRKYGPQATIIGFYTTMEILQTIQYNYLDQCDFLMTKFLTIIAHFLVCVQPSLWNWYRFKTNEKHCKIFSAFFWLGVIFAIFYTRRLVVGLLNPLAAIFSDNEMNVGKQICTLQGPSHICWVLPYASFGGLEPNYFTYLLIWFFPSIYEDRYPIIKLIFWLTQITLISFISYDKHENNSIWCLLSIPIVFGLFLTTRATTED
ncbi:MAG: transmembrane domain-containing protein [Hyperionvirus sp.]|uniref:Transmembrane domain-containing protein n=1 Tax=Hyperionvirus sp. TaxID=2487770 RepID=A0A3G5A833_9VIRU|nr:MAG: transmembrane domain-containing protein [Hyperionvirus sp.]